MSEDPIQLSAAQKGTLTALLDELIPPKSDGSMPGAGELGLADEVLAAVLLPESQVELQEGLAALDAEGLGDGASDFASSSREARLAALGRVNEARPSFIPTLLRPTYIAYYQNGRVARSLGLEAWPPHPEGFPLEVGDLSLLDPVRARGPMFRET
jgi:hypothetical protein